MRIKLGVVVGLPRGKEFLFDGHEVFLAGRSHRCHFQADERDKAFSRVHFMVEINPPLCRLVDLGSRNGTLVNGKKATQADLRNGDQIQVGQTSLRLTHLSDPTIGAAAATDEPLSGALFRSGLSGSKSGMERLPPGIPRQIAGYRILREIGRGIAGVTCAALREIDSATVAIKVIDPPMTGARPMIEKFLHDLALVRQLDNPHLLRIRDHGESARQLFVVSDFVPGMNAAQFVQQRGKLTPRLAIGIMLPVLQALEHCHAKGVAHGAVKPSNILIEEQEGKARIRLVDCGVTHAFEASPLSGLTLTGQWGDGIHFLPPERLKKYHEAKPASDQYAAAATLYHLLTGAQLYDFQAPSAHAFAQVVNDDPVAIRMRRGDLSDELALAVHKALAREPGDRYPSIADFRHALQAIAKPKPAPAAQVEE